MGLTNKCAAGALALMAACAPVEGEFTETTFAQKTVSDASLGTQAGVQAATEAAADSVEHQVLSRRFSVEAARGDLPLLKSDGDTVSNVFSFTNALKEEPASFATKDARGGGFTLDDAVQAALAQDIEIARAAEQLTKAEVAETNAALGYFPRVSGVGELLFVSQDVINTDNAVFQEGNAEFSVLTGTVEATQPLIDISRLLAIRVAEVETQASELAYISATQRSVFNAISSYLTALEAQTQMRSVTKRLALLNEQRDAEQRLIDSGFATDTARELVEVEIGRNEIEQLEYQTTLAASLKELGTLIGQPIATLEPVTLSVASRENVGRDNPDAYVSAALRSNPEMQRLRLVSLAERKEFERQLAEDFAPRLEGFARAEYEDREASRFGGGSETFDATVGLRLTVPIFNASGQGYRSFEARSDARLAILNEANLHRALDVEVRALANELDAYRRLIVKSEGAFNSANKLLASAKRRVASGQAVPIEVLRQQLQVERAREWVERSRYSFIRSWARLSFLTGAAFEL